MRSFWLPFKPAGAFLVAILFMSQAAVAQNGVVLLSQDTNRYPFFGVIPGVCSTRFPMVICQSGSYRLASNIQINDVNTTAIQIAADNVTLDLNGFTISGPVTCTQGSFGRGSSCSAGGTGIGITSSNNNVTVTNGTVRGMGSVGIYLMGFGSTVDGAHANGNGNVSGAGIMVQDGLVTRCIANFNAGSGITAPGSTVTQNTTSYNGGAGIAAGDMVSNNTARFNGADGIADYGSAIGNSVSGNDGYGLRVPGSYASGYGSNTMENNMLGPVSGGTSMKNNVCDGSVC